MMIQLQKTFKIKIVICKLMKIERHRLHKTSSFLAALPPDGAIIPWILENLFSIVYRLKRRQNFYTFLLGYLPP